MADKKISALTGASTPLAGTEVLPIVQGGATVNVSVANLTAGRPVAMGGGSFTDNITQSTAAKGVNFTANTPAAGMTSQLLNWYEEGTWTPNQGTGLVVIGTFTSSGKYTRIGRQVTVVGRIRGGTSVSATGAGQITSNLPFAANDLFIGNVINDTVTASSGIYTSSTSINAVTAISATSAIYFSVTYFI